MTKPLAGYKIGFIGLGLMGRPMAEHLHAAGAEITVHNRSRHVVDELAALGMRVASGPADVARAAGGKFILLSLTRTASVEEVVSGERGLLAAVKPGTLVVDLGTTAVQTTRQIDRDLRARGAALLDAPVSGGEVGAKTASLTIMAGGGNADFARALPILQALGKKITHLGPSGAGQVAKMANQVIVALTIDAVAEALALAEAAGVDPGRVRDALSGGFADSRILELHGERMVRREFSPGGRASGQLKDVREACRLMEEVGLDLPTLKSSLALWEKLVEIRGLGHLDHSALFTLYDEQLNSRTGIAGTDSASALT